MSTDKELLEWAAKAIVRPDDFSNQHYMRGMLSTWNPLTDDGDALRLVVKLRLCVSVEFDRVDATARPENATEYFYDNPPTDPYAATRRAIVRAAAAIGKAMKP